MFNSIFSRIITATGILLLSLFILNLDNAEAATLKKASVTAKVEYWGPGQSGASNGTGVDLFMDAKDGATFAAKLNSDVGSTVRWAVAGFIGGPIVGTASSVLGTALVVGSQDIANKVLNLTDKGKKVHIYAINGHTTVTEWDGSHAQVKSSLGTSWSKTYGGITYGATVTELGKEYYY